MVLTNRPILLLCILAFLTGVLWIGERDFCSRGEAREVLAAQSVLDGNWAVPRGYGGVVASKPPLLHWIIAAFSLPGGRVSELTARLPSVIASAVFLICFFIFLQPRVGRRAAMLTVLLLGASIEWFRFSIDARVDMLHSVFLAGSLCCLFAWYEKGYSGVPVLMVIFMTGATLAKGPVGLVIPSIVLLAHVQAEGLSNRRKWVLLLKILPPTALLASLWYVTALVEGGSEFLAKFSYENFARFTSTMEDQPHQHTIFYLPATLFAGLMPWILVFTPGLLRKYVVPFARSIFHSMRATPASFRWLSVRLRIQRKIVLWWERFREWYRTQGTFERFAFVSLMVVLIFYSIPSSKRSVYLLSAYPFIAYLFSQHVLRLGILQRRTATGSFVFLCTGIIVLYAAVALAGLGLFHLPSEILGPDSVALLGFGLEQLQLLSAASWLHLFVLFLPLMTAVIAVLPRQDGKRMSFLGGTFAITFSLYLAFHAVLAPQLASSTSPRPFAMEIAPIVGESHLYSFGNEFYGLSFYLQKEMATIRENFSEGMYLVAYETRLGDLNDAASPRYRASPIVFSANGVEDPLRRLVLVRIEKL